MTFSLRSGAAITTAEQERQLQTLAGGFGMVVRVLNNGHHVEFKRSGLLLDWWPSKGRYMVNKVSDRPALLTSLNAVRGKLEQLQWKPPPPMKERSPRRTPDSGAEFVPDYSRRCAECNQLGALPFCGKCGPCKFGPMRFSQ